MRSIKKRLAGNFILVIVITVFILEIFLVNAVKRYYYKNIEDMMSNQIKFSSDFYSKYFSTSSLEDIVIDDIDVFWQQTNAQVQILNLDGYILMDSIGVNNPEKLDTIDVKKALNGEKGTWIGNVGYDTEPVMAVSYPIKSDGKNIGIIRFITSLRETNRSIKNISKLFILIGVIVIFISAMVSLFLANTIVKPLEEVTEVAEKMASGQLKVRNKKRFNDEIGKLSDTLNYMAEELLKKEQLKNDFVSSISHELRTPLTSIKGWAITLKSEELNDEQLLKDGLDIIEKESDRLTLMVEDLLDFSKFISGRITLTKEEIDIRDTVNQMEKQLMPKAKANNIDFKVICSENIPIIVADENRIKQVLINLIDNAFKYTSEEGEVIFSADYKDGFIEICVKDNGLGISEEELPYIKEKFYKGYNSSASSGLGLSICDEIVNLHNGQLIIESEKDIGTKVFVKLPIEEEK